MQSLEQWRADSDSCDGETVHSAAHNLLCASVQTKNMSSDSVEQPYERGSPGVLLRGADAMGNFRTWFQGDEYGVGEGGG
jgi:hypothetical protein